MQTHSRDQFVKQARCSNYRSRAAYKLMQIDHRDRLFLPGQVVVDLGAAPGSWSQYVHQRVGSRGKVIAVDVLDMAPLTDVVTIKGDFTDASVFEKCIEVLPDGIADLVISDMAPNLSGIRSTDQARSMLLADLVYDFSNRVLRPGGDMLIKLFQGQGTDAFKREVMERFQRVMTRKPEASRNSSREFYILARGYVV